MTPARPSSKIARTRSATGCPPRQLSSPVYPRAHAPCPSAAATRSRTATASTSPARTSLWKVIGIRGCPPTSTPATTMTRKVSLKARRAAVKRSASPWASKLIHSLVTNLTASLLLFFSPLFEAVRETDYPVPVPRQASPHSLNASQLRRWRDRYMQKYPQMSTSVLSGTHRSRNGPC